MVGHVPSPTPIVGMSGDSIKVMVSVVLADAAMRQAASHPAVPPPTITTLEMAVSTLRT